MSKSGLGTSLGDICKGQQPWTFHNTPIIPSKYHNVLYHMPVSLQSVPKPHFNKQPKHWDEGYVRMPFAIQNLFPMEENGKDVLKPRWDIICKALSQPINSSEDFERIVHSYNSPLPKFGALHHFFQEILEEEETLEFFSRMLPKIIKLALQLPNIVPGSVPLLRQHECRSLSFSQMQVASLLANAFLCTFPWRKDTAGSYPGVNFVRLYTAHLRPKRLNCVAEKIKSLIHYFRRIMDERPVGVITFERKWLPRKSIPRWDNLNNNLGNTKLHITSAGTIEDDGIGFLQVDFANKNVGGGVLGYGCVQEEIRFVICPELIISRLFVEQLTDTEAVVVTGIERFSEYDGYGDTFQWSGNFVDDTPFDEDGRRKTTISIIDAVRFNKPGDQYYPSALLREVTKAYVGFSSNVKENLSPVATGNWGCGAYKGDARLKSLLQLMACNAAHRDLVYFSFGNDELRDDIYNMYLFIAINSVTITELWRIFCRFITTKLPQNQLYAFIQQSYFDTKGRVSMKTLSNDVRLFNAESASTSGSQRRNNLKKRSADEGVMENQMHLDHHSDDNIIESSPTEDDRKFVFMKKYIKEKPFKDKGKKQFENNHNEVLEMFGKIDGPRSRSEGTTEDSGDSFLQIVDKLSRKPVQEISIQIEDDRDADEDMDTESIILVGDGEQEKSNSGKTKVKISDYFTKINKTSS